MNYFIIIFKYLLTLEFFRALLAQNLKWILVKLDKSAKLEGANLSKKEEEELTLPESLSLHLPIPFQISFKELSEEIKNFGCYFLSISFLASVLKEVQFLGDKCFDVSETILLKNGLARNKGLQAENCYVLNPNSILADFGIGKQINFKGIKEKNYVLGSSEFAIGMFEKNKMTHFAVLNQDLAIAWDSLIDSSVIKNGELKTLRVFAVNDEALAQKMKIRLHFYREQFLQIKEERQ